ncbi:hypothetical protein Y1Q_0015290 [Alligator mississippiensis]|uniref:Uncharacterized protein n=1 Tax=Alligator mississippiensis TaxID=8496 RepID=A0A151P3X2_ALLMI|nr:hypothetical protein Y1Q_0015290 [Alligator mississippiensis]
MFLCRCPDQSCKQDLLAYLEQIKLYSHQLKICSQVRAEIQNLGEELIMSARYTDGIQVEPISRQCVSSSYYCTFFIAMNVFV